MDTVDYFPHGSEILIVANLENGAVSAEGIRIHGRYYKAREIYILDADQPGNFPIPLVCSGEECVLDTVK